MIGRKYTLSFEAVAVTAAQDLFELVAASGKPIDILSIRIGQSSDAGDASDMHLAPLGAGMVAAWVEGSSGHIVRLDAAGAMVGSIETIDASLLSGADDFRVLANGDVGWICGRPVGMGFPGTKCTSGSECRSGFCGDNGFCFRACKGDFDCPQGGQVQFVCADTTIVVDGKKVTAGSCVPQ